MQKSIIILLFSLGFTLLFVVQSSSQIIPKKFGKGIQILGQDSSYHIKIGFRFQNLFVSQWNLANDKFETMEDYKANFLIRRARLKFDGFAFSPKLKYKLELGLSNRDLGGGNTPEFSNASNLILDAYVRWNFFQNFSIQLGQAKLPGNRERIISSGNLQFVDRSRLNSRFTIDRGYGIQLFHHFTLGKSFLVKEIISISQGDGRNVTTGFYDGFDYTFKVELLPFGKFQSKGDYIGSAIKRESKPKMAIGVSYDTNINSIRERGTKGSFITDDEGVFFGKTLNTFFVDMMFKYKNFSFMGEYALRDTEDNISTINDKAGKVIGTFYTGSALNLQAGYMLKKNWEVAIRYTDVDANEGVANDETRYTLGISKYIVGHKLKVQTDFTLRTIDQSDDDFIWRTQVDIHF